jgi:hypothetical protein
MFCSLMPQLIQNCRFINKPLCKQILDISSAADVGFDIALYTLHHVTKVCYPARLAYVRRYSNFIYSAF